MGQDGNTPTCAEKTCRSALPTCRCWKHPHVRGEDLPPTPLIQRWRGREGDPGRPQGGRSAKAGADITRPTGPGRFAPMPRATRGGRGTVPLKRPFSRYRKRGVRGCRGCRGGTPLTPCPAPGRRPAARAGQQPQYREKGISHRSDRNVIPHVCGETLRYGEAAAGDMAPPHMRGKVQR